MKFSLRITFQKRHGFIGGFHRNNVQRMIILADNPLVKIIIIRIIIHQHHTIQFLYHLQILYRKIKACSFSHC